MTVRRRRLGEARLSDEEIQALFRKAALGDPLARQRLERLLDRQPTDETGAALQACEEALGLVFGSWWVVEPDGRRLVAKSLARAFRSGRGQDFGNFWIVFSGPAVWIGRPRGQGPSPARPGCFERLALERWARLNS